MGSEMCIRDRIEWGDTIRNPKLLSDDKLMKFEVVVANPPFSLDKWGQDEAKSDPFERFHRGLPPQNRGDFAFILHMIETLTESSGRVAVVTPLGVLFRAGNEGRIRRSLVETNLLDAVIGLPRNLFYGTDIPAAILVFRKQKDSDSVFFIDASQHYQSITNQNLLRPEDIKKIVDVYLKRKNSKKYSHSASFKEIKANDFDLNIPRYVDTFEDQVPEDLSELQRSIHEMDDKLNEVRAELNGILGELDING